jgi:hypothetical protein
MKGCPFIDHARLIAVYFPLPRLVIDLSCFFAILAVMAESSASFTDWIQNVLKSIGEMFSNLRNSLFPARDKILAHPEYQTERAEFMQVVKDDMEQKGIAVDANGYGVWSGYM